ncbi:MAG: spore cortex biosynthesis protein YabQ [Oscillospiraceae bacterium]|nr:spore cortex biosynthesis protein YabQ [Oscillospiraceae bacterium]
MFTPATQSISQLLSFTILGFFTGIFYEIIRIIRLFRRQSDIAVNITDFLFLCVAGVITFAYSMELGNGDFRWFYVVGQLFGAVVYFATVGRLVSLASNFIVKCVKKAWAFAARCFKQAMLFIYRHIALPIKRKICAILLFLGAKIVYFYGFIRKQAIISSNHLKSRAKVLYNRSVAKKSNKKITGKIPSRTLRGTLTSRVAQTSQVTPPTRGTSTSQGLQSSRGTQSSQGTQSLLVTREPASLRGVPKNVNVIKGAIKGTTKGAVKKTTPRKA